MCRILYVEHALARMLAWPVGCWQKRRHPWLPITLRCTRASRARSRAIPTRAALTRTHPDPAAPAHAPAAPVLCCLLWVRRHPPHLQHVVSSRVGGDRVGAGPGMVLSALAAREGAPGSGRRVPCGDWSVAFAPRDLAQERSRPLREEFKKGSRVKNSRKATMCQPPHVRHVCCGFHDPRRALNPLCGNRTHLPNLTSDTLCSRSAFVSPRQGAAVHLPALAGCAAGYPSMHQGLPAVLHRARRRCGRSQRAGRG